MSDILRYLQAGHAAFTDDGEHSLRIAIITNFTDDLFRKALKGMCIVDGIPADVRTVGFKQYAFDLKNPASGLHTFKPNITFVFFDINPYAPNEFLVDPHHAKEILSDLAAYARSTDGMVIVQNFIAPSLTPFETLSGESPMHALAREWNDGIAALAHEYKNVIVADTTSSALTTQKGIVYDLRSLYAYRQPFTHEFILRICQEWLAHIRLRTGKIRKCIVVDLDNVLWGGVVGEAGPMGIELGEEYPGNTFRAFQSLLKQYADRGVLLAINSRNNPEDVHEVFVKNPHMILKEEDFAVSRINWESKADNIVSIADELNIGLESLVFIDDDPMNRDLVRAQAPEVLVPDFSLPPEEYGKALMELHAFPQSRITEEDTKRGKMMAEERERRTVRAATQDLDSYIRELHIELDLHKNNPDLLPRVAQLTQKTNQFNLTTRRYEEGEIADFERKGAWIIAGDLRDKFGSYGVTLVAIVLRPEPDTAELDTLLMSCRVMGRRVETAFLNAIMEVLAKEGVKTLHANFIPTMKNRPAAGFLPSMGFKESERLPDGGIRYTRALGASADQSAEGASKSITIRWL